MDFYKIYDILMRFNDILYNLLYVIILFIVYKYIQNLNQTKINEINSLQNSINEIKKNYDNEIVKLHNSLKSQEIINNNILCQIENTENNLISFIHCVTRNINITKVPKYLYLNSKNSNNKEPNHINQFLEIFKTRYNSDVRTFIKALDDDDKMDLLQDNLNNIEYNHYSDTYNRYARMKQYKNPAVRYLATNHIYNDNLLKYLDSNLLL